jgi:hypothetical protein
MPTQSNFAASRSESATKIGKRPGTLANEALAVEKPSLTVMPTHTTGEMTKAEALEVAWTGLEALARMNQARLYRSPRTGRVLIELLAVELTEANGLKALAVDSKGDNQ